METFKFIVRVTTRSYISLIAKLSDEKYMRKLIRFKNRIIYLVCPVCPFNHLNRYNPFHCAIKSQLLGTKWPKHQDLQIFDLKLNKYELFSPPEVVGRGDETQRQVGEKIND